ncbi:MAG: hypothetical protein GY839_06530 [candidate division Zixibacteria bacterium]|nr:hypothetical protein [candidate division Zixibacteria bacterium]
MLWGIGYLLVSSIAFACGVQFITKVGIKKISVSFSIAFFNLGLSCLSIALVFINFPGGSGFKDILFKSAGYMLPLLIAAAPYLLLLVSRRYGRIELQSNNQRISILSKLTGLVTIVILSYVAGSQVVESVVLETGVFWVLKGFLAKEISLILGIILIISLLNFESTWRAASGVVKNQVLCMMIIDLIILGGLVRLFFLGQVSTTFIGYGMPLILLNLAWLYFLLLRKDTYSSNVVVDRQAFFSSALILFLGVFLVFTGIVALIIDKAGGRTDIFLSVLGAFLVIGIFLLVLISDSLRNRFSRIFQSRIYAGEFDYRTEWRTISDDFAASDTLEGLIDSLSSRINSLFYPKCLAVFEGDDNTMNSVYPPESDYPSISASDPAARWVFLKAKPALIGQIDVKDESKLLDIARDFEIIVPLVAARKLVGILLLGPKNNNSDYNSEDFAMLSAVSYQAAVTVLHLRSQMKLLETEKLASFHKTASFVVHDLKNAVSMLSLMLQNAPRKMSDPMFQKESIKTISLAVGRMQKIIEKLKSPTRKEHLQVYRLDPMKSFDRALEKSGIGSKRNISVKIDSDEKLQVISDPGILESVFVNLLINAVEAMPDGGTITIEQQQVDSKILISVADTGIGMNKSFITNKLFRPFETTKAAGLGIGLYQCREMMRETGGDIIAKSKPGKGSRFTVILPC